MLPVVIMKKSSDIRSNISLYGVTVPHKPLAQLHGELQRVRRFGLTLIVVGLRGFRPDVGNPFDQLMTSGRIFVSQRPAAVARFADVYQHVA
jgi:hypothetical protein